MPASLFSTEEGTSQARVRGREIQKPFFGPGSQTRTKDEAGVTVYRIAEA